LSNLPFIIPYTLPRDADDLPLVLQAARLVLRLALALLGVLDQVDHVHWRRVVRGNAIDRHIEQAWSRY